jgi:hypothetical protein
MRKRLPLVIATGAIICIVVAAALSLTWVLGADGEAKSGIPVRSASEALPPEPPPPASPPSQSIAQQFKSCFWSKGKRRWCLDEYESKEYANSWADDGGWNEPWEITQYEGDSRYYVYDHRDRVEGYLRPAIIRGAWRAHVFTCLIDPPPKAWSKQGCGYVRDGIAIPASRNVLLIYTKGRMVGTARGPGRIGVAAYKLVRGDLR